MSNILLLEGGNYIGGGQLMSLNISKILVEKYKLIIAIPKKNNEFKNLFKSEKWEIVEYSFKKKNDGKKNFFDILRYSFELLQNIPKLVMYAKKSNIGLIYIQSQKMVPIGVIVGKIINKPVVVHLHVYHVDKKSRYILNLFLKFGCVKKIVGVSNYALSQLHYKNIKKSEVIYNFIDISRDLVNNKEEKIFSSLEEKDFFNIAVLANVMPEKGQDIAIKAMKFLKKYKIKLYIVGSIRDKLYFNELKKEIKHYSLEANVVFTGKLDNVNYIYENIHLLLVPSRAYFETFSLSMVEAWNKGIPTVASDLGGMKELVEKYLPKYKEYMLFHNNEIKELAKRCDVFVKNRDLRIEISKQIRYIAHLNFSKEIFEKKIYGVLKDTLNQ